MIDPKELMIGNLIMIDNEKHHSHLKDIPLIVTAINPKPGIGYGESLNYSISLEHINQKPNTYYESYSQFIKFLKPIPLTEDILKRLGFVWNNGTLRKERFRFMDKQERFGGGFSLFIGDYYAKHIKNVHELQSIYYWNSGKKKLVWK